LESGSTHDVKTACIRALTSNPNKPLLELEIKKLLYVCDDQAENVREAAHCALVSWLTK
jgi:hypothetical protein